VLLHEQDTSKESPIQRTTPCSTTAVHLGPDEIAPSLAKHQGAEVSKGTDIAQMNSAFTATKEWPFEGGIKKTL